MNLNHIVSWAAQHCADDTEGMAFVLWVSEQEHGDPTITEVGYPALLRAFRGERGEQTMPLEWDSLAGELRPVRRY